MYIRDIARKIYLILSSVRLVPHIIILLFSKNRELLTLDLERWSFEKENKKLATTGDRISSFIKMMSFYPEYRNLFYCRLDWVAQRTLSILSRPMNTLYIVTKDIGPGLYIQHGFSTIIAAKKIGKNCWINQQVTIGYSNETDIPTIGDHVFIFAGAKVIGNISIGNNSKIGANAVVVKNVPENCIVVGVPAYIVRRNGKKTKETL